MSKSLIKAGNVTVEPKDKKRVIDSNQAISDRLKLLNEILERSGINGDYESGFSEGLAAERIDGEEFYGDDYPDSNGKNDISQEDIDKIIEDANTQAEEIVSQANQNADDIVKSAQAEANGIKQKAYDEGRAKGEEAGYNDGMKQVTAMQQELEEEKKRLEEEYDQKITELEPRFVKTLTDIYEHIFHVDLSDKTELILYLLKDAIRNIDGAKNFFVHVSKDDYEFVLEHANELSQGLASSDTVEIIEDISLSAGEGFVEAESGIFDCGIDTELKLLKKELMQLSYTAGQE